ncbi:hypothetical protein LguiA_029586 [Lonicera macranthoides]
MLTEMCIAVSKVAPKLRFSCCWWKRASTGAKSIDSGGWEFYVVQAELAMTEMWMELQIFQARLSVVEMKS